MVGMNYKRLVKRVLRVLPDEAYLRLRYFLIFRRLPDLKNPKTFNEKLQWLKLHDRDPEYTRMVDKFEAKKYVAERIGEEYIIPTLGVWDRFEDIDFDTLPDQFVLKCTHDSGGVVICREKSSFDVETAREKLTTSLKENYYWEYREWPYKDVKPRIIGEEYLPGEDGELLDYKLLCFHGEVKCTYVCSQRYSGSGMHVDFYDRNWEKMPFERYYPSSDIFHPKPENYELMVEKAEALAKGMRFLRVDFYENCGRIYFGELTFYPGSGLRPFNPPQWDNTLGSWIHLSDREQK